MKSGLIGLLGLVAVCLAVIRSADYLHTLWRHRPAGGMNLRRSTVLAAATSVSSAAYAHAVGFDCFLLTAALVNSSTALLSVVLPPAPAAPVALEPADAVDEGGATP